MEVLETSVQLLEYFLDQAIRMKISRSRDKNIIHCKKTGINKTIFENGDSCFESGLLYGFISLGEVHQKI